MIEIIKETISELKKIKIDDEESKKVMSKSLKNLEFIVKEYKRLIDDFIDKSRNQ
tara:strand:- start:288 stop:452 length:165 start_codon:yes stop_codon:yes gene_type:complete